MQTALKNLRDMNSSYINFAREDYTKVYIAGFAKDYCVAESVKDMMKEQRLSGKLVFLNKCMASIDKNSESLKVYEDAVKDFGAIIEE